MNENVISTNSMETHTNNKLQHKLPTPKNSVIKSTGSKKQQKMNILKQLSIRYLQTAKKLGYTWFDLLKRSTRHNVITKVHIYEAKKDAVNEQRFHQKHHKMLREKEKMDTIREQCFHQKYLELLREQEKTNAVRERRIRQKYHKMLREQIRIKKDKEYRNLETTPEIKIEQMNTAHKGYTKTYRINIINNKGPLIQLQNTRTAIRNHLKNILQSMKGLKFIETLKIIFQKEVYGLWENKTAYFNSTAQIIINDSEIDNALQFSKQKILYIIAQWISGGSGWTIKSVDNHFLNVVKYQPLKGSSYIDFPQELRYNTKGLINMKNDDNDCFRWCHIKHLNLQIEHPQRTTKSDKEYIKKLDYTGIEFPVTIKHITKIEIQNSIRISVFGYEDKKPYPIYVSKEEYADEIDLLLIT